MEMALSNVCKEKKKKSRKEILACFEPMTWREGGSKSTVEPDRERDRERDRESETETKCC